jgi:hypothetical protein
MRSGNEVSICETFCTNNRLGETKNGIKTLSPMYICIPVKRMYVYKQFNLCCPFLKGTKTKFWS